MISIAKASGWTVLRADRLALAVIFLAGLFFYNSIQLHHDVAWYVYCNLRQLEGVRPYIDIIEVSPPIAFYLTLLPVAIASATGLPVKICVVIYVLIMTAGSLLLAMAVDGQASVTERRWKMVAGATILMIVPIGVFAQREHFAILLALPYFYVCAARLSGQKVSLRIAITAGLMAGIGLSIKHYFLLAPFMIEAYLIYARGSLRSLFRSEIYAAIVAGSLYAAFVIIVHPEYFTVSVPLILAAYQAYSLPLWLVAAQPWNMAALLGIIFWLLARWRIADAPTADLFFVAASAFLLCVFWQDKGWAYHSLPANLMLAFAAMELMAASASGRAKIKGLSRRQKYTIPAAPIVLLLLQTFMTGPYRNNLALDAAGYVERYAPEGNVFMMSSNLSAGFPLVLDTHATWSSRFATQWLLPDVIRGMKYGKSLTSERREQLKWLAALDIDATVADFEKFKPDIVFVDRNYQEQPTRLYDGISVDMIAYYQRDARFATIWQNYRKVDTLTTYLIDMDRSFEVWVRQVPSGS